MEQYYIDRVYTSTKNQRDRELAEIVKKYENSLLTIEPRVLRGWVENYVQALNQQYTRCKPLGVSYLGMLDTCTAYISVHVEGRSDMPVVSIATRKIKRVIESEEDL